jgi:hypothetical protein
MYTPLPEFVGKVEDLEDPITLDPLEKNSLYAFYINKTTQKFYVAGSFESIFETISKNFRGSNYANIFVPTLNEHYPFNDLVWFST